MKALSWKKRNQFKLKVERNQLSLDRLFTFALFSLFYIIIPAFARVRVNSNENCYEENFSDETYLYNQRFDGLEKAFPLGSVCIKNFLF